MSFFFVVIKGILVPKTYIYFEFKVRKTSPEIKHFLQEKKLVQNSIGKTHFPAYRAIQKGSEDGSAKMKATTIQIEI